MRTQKFDSDPEMKFPKHPDEIAREILTKMEKNIPVSASEEEIISNLEASFIRRDLKNLNEIESELLNSIRKIRLREDKEDIQNMYRH